MYGPHKVKGRWRTYVGTVEEVIVRKDHKGHKMQAAIVQWMDQDDEDTKRPPYQEARLRVRPRVGRCTYTGSWSRSKRLGSRKARKIRQGRKRRKGSNN